MIYGLDHNVDRGKIKGLKNKSESLSLTIGSYGRGWGAHVRVSLRSGTVLSRKVVGETAHSPVQSDSPLRPQRYRGHTKRRNANRQVKNSWLKEVRKGERGAEDREMKKKN